MHAFGPQLGLKLAPEQILTIRSESVLESSQQLSPLNEALSGLHRHIACKLFSRGTMRCCRITFCFASLDERCHKFQNFLVSHRIPFGHELLMQLLDKKVYAWEIGRASCRERG